MRVAIFLQWESSVSTCLQLSTVSSVTTYRSTVKRQPKTFKKQKQNSWLNSTQKRPQRNKKHQPLMLKKANKTTNSFYCNSNSSLERETSLNLTRNLTVRQNSLSMLPKSMKLKWNLLEYRSLWNLNNPLISLLLLTSP